jgi:CRISPR-associated endonuclease/helicase Cas3
VRDWVGGRAEVVLLHSRFPARRREELTAQVTARLGKDPAPRNPMVVVATQVIEQSLDLDFDLMVSDLAPAAQLLQRAGRCHRHARPQRPAIAAQPRLVVLDPRDGQGRYRQPKHWGRVYASYLLRATHLMLAALPGAGIQVPDDVQPVMESVYGRPAFDDAQLQQEHIEYQAEAMAQGQYAGFVNVPPPSLVMDLSGMSDKNVEEAMAVTRLGADSLRIVCCYLDHAGNRYLDPQLRRPLPDGGLQGRLSVEAVRQVLAETIPVRASLLAGYVPTEPVPAAWTTDAWLKDVVPVWFPAAENGPLPVLFGQREVSLDPDVGLLIEQQ